MKKIDFTFVAKEEAEKLEWGFDSKGPANNNLILPAEEEAKKWKEWRNGRLHSIAQAEARYNTRLKSAYESGEIDSMELTKHSLIGSFGPFEKMIREVNETYHSNVKFVF
ncbi:MAG: hypothetical protein ABFQ65_04785 [Nanoarchaeota archaeon]